MTAWVEDLAWPEIERRAADGALALLPIGASSKEHGYHLPLGTDAKQACHFANAMAARFDALIWPLVNYGYYPVFTEYPGSTSLSGATFASLVVEVLEGIAASGVQRIVLLNTGISTIAPLEEALARLPTTASAYLLNCYAGSNLAAAKAELEQQAWGGHADEIETALMLAIDADLVNMPKAVGNEQPIVRGKFNRSNKQAPNYSPSGANGNPALANLTKGEKLLEALLSDLEDAIRAYLAVAFE